MGLRILIPKPRIGRRLGRMRRFVWVAFGVAIWGTAYTLLGASGMVGVFRARQEVDHLEARVEQAREQNARLEQRIHALKTDPNTIERLAREKLFLARDGETIYLLPRRSPKETSPPLVAEPRQSARPDTPRRP